MIFTTFNQFHVTFDDVDIVRHVNIVSNDINVEELKPIFFKFVDLKNVLFLNLEKKKN